MRKTFITPCVAAGALALAATASPVHATTVDATGTTFTFGVDGQTVTDVSNLGYGGYAEGTSIRYTNVATIGGTVIDAVVTFQRGTNLYSWETMTEDQIERIDDTFPDDEEDPYIELALGGDEQGGEATAEITVDFYEGGTDTPVTISNLPMNVYDIDNEQWFEVEGAAGYSVSTNTHLTVTNPASGTYRFSSPDAGTDSDDGTSYTVGRAKVILASASSVTFRVAIPNGPEANGTFDVDFSAGLPWQDSVGGSENTSTLPATGAGSVAILVLGLAFVAAGAAITARRRTHA